MQISHWMDAHAHIFPEKIAAKATESIGHFYDVGMSAPAGLSSILLEEGAKAGIEKYLVCSTATTARQVESIDSFIAQECEKHPEFVGLATMHPDYADIRGELERAKGMGLRGIKLHPDFQLFAIDDPIAYPIYEAAAELDFVVLFHTGDDRYTYSSPVQLARVAEKFPRMRCIAAHFGGYREWDAADRVLRGAENVWFDTSSSLTCMTAQEAADRIHAFGATRMMYGTDFPMWNPSQEKERFLAIPLTNEEREQIAWKTFTELFQLII